MIGIDGLIVVSLVASEACVWCIAIIPVVTSGAITGDCGMCSVENIVVIMDVKRGRNPFALGMTGRAVIVKL